jgi:hypothetical protein
MLGVAVAAALRWRLPAAAALWAVGAAGFVLAVSVLEAAGPRGVPGALGARLRAAGQDLGRVLDGLGRLDPRPLWALPAAPFPAEAARRLPAAAREWLSLAGAASLTLLALAGLSR